MKNSHSIGPGGGVPAKVVEVIVVATEWKRSHHFSEQCIQDESNWIASNYDIGVYRDCHH